MNGKNIFAKLANCSWMVNIIGICIFQVKSIKNKPSIIKKKMNMKST